MAMPGRECLYLFMEDEVGGAQQADSKAQAEMDEEVWRRLPEDVLRMVLVRVPILSHRRFMCVCKRWRSMISEPAFARECDSAAVAGSAKACLCSFGGPELAGQQQLLLQLPHACLRRRMINPSCLPGGGSFPLDLWASDKGLLCFSKRKQGYGETYLYVCNPVMRMWKRLPVLRFEEFEVLHRAFMQVLKDDQNREWEYKVVLLAKTLAGNCRIFVYSSDSSRWKRMNWEVEAPSGNREPVLCKGVIHVWRSSPGLEKIEDSSFCIRSGMEVKNMTQPPPAAFRKLVEVEGCLFLVSFLEPFTGILIWKLEEEKSVWEHVSGCPAKEYMRITASHMPPVVARLKVGVVAGFICLCTEKAMSRPALAYDTQGKTWCTWDFGVADPRCRKKVFPFQAIFMHLHN